MICPPPRAAVAERKGRGLFPLAATGAPCVRALSLSRARASPRLASPEPDRPPSRSRGRKESPSWSVRRRGLAVSGGVRQSRAPPISSFRDVSRRVIVESLIGLPGQSRASRRVLDLCRVPPVTPVVGGRRGQNFHFPILCAAAAGSQPNAGVR